MFMEYLKKKKIPYKSLLFVFKITFKYGYQEWKLHESTQKGT